MSENIWKLGPAFRGPEDLAHLWIDLGAEPLYEISAGKTVYARHRIVEFFIGPGSTEAERASLLAIAQNDRSHDVTLVIPIDEKTWDAIDEASDWVGNRPQFVTVPVLDINGEPFGELRMNSIDGCGTGTDLGLRWQIPVLVKDMNVGEQMTCHLVNDNRQRLVFEVVRKYRKSDGGIMLQQIVEDEQERPEPQLLNVRPNEIVYFVEPHARLSE